MNLITNLFQSSVGKKYIMAITGGCLLLFVLGHLAGNLQIFLGREIATHRDFSEETARLIDQEIREIVENAEKQACEIIKKNIDLLHKLALALLEKEVLDGAEIAKILGNSEVNSANIFVNKSDDNMTKPATKAKTGSRRRKSEKEKGANTDQAA